MIPHTKPCFGVEEANACYEYMMAEGYVTEYTYTRQLEKKIAEFTGAKHCVMVNNGTISLTLAFLALDLKAGDEIIIPNLTMVASLNAATLIGLKPILVDVSSNTLTLCVNKIQNYVTAKTKAILHVSLNGRGEKMSELREWCDKNELYLIEDAAQSFGSFYDKHHLGTFGHIGSFSFSIPKIISTGQGGALITDDDEIANKIRRLKDFGRAVGGEHDYEGFGINAKFTDIQAVIGLEQMKKLKRHITRKKEIWNQYYEELLNVDGIEMLKPNDDGWVPWVVDIYVKDPRVVREHLKQKGIDTRSQYPLIFAESATPVSGRYSSRGLWLPATIETTADQIKYVCQCLKELE